MKRGETPETATRREVAERLTPLLGAAAARDAADALGGAPTDIAWNGSRLADAIEAAIVARGVAVRAEIEREVGQDRAIRGEWLCEKHAIKSLPCGCGP